MDQLLPGDQVIPRKKIPSQRKFNINTEKRDVRSIDLQVPLILRDNDQMIKRLNKSKIHIDSIRHKNNLIVQTKYSPQMNRLIVLDSYSDGFSIYKDDCTLESKITPKFNQLKGLVCTDFDWSEKQQRIGAIFRGNPIFFLRGLARGRLPLLWLCVCVGGL